MVTDFANVLVNPSQTTQEICLKYVAGMTPTQIAKEYPDLPMGVFDVYDALFWLDNVLDAYRQVRPDEWETVVDNL